jgi:hypothetical protein
MEMIEEQAPARSGQRGRATGTAARKAAGINGHGDDDREKSRRPSRALNDDEPQLLRRRSVLQKPFMSGRGTAR